MINRFIFSLLVGIASFIVLDGCGNDHSERSLKKKAAADSVRRADSLEKNKVAIENLKHSLKDSVLAVKEFDEQVAKYDSLRKMDSLKVKWKRRDPIKPAPKRELWAKSPIR